MVATWLAQSAVEEVRPLFAKANIPDFETPTEAIKGIMQIARYVRAQTELMQTPRVAPENRVNPVAVDAAIGRALAQRRSMMTEPEAKAVLSAYGIPTVPTKVAATPEEAARAAADLLRGYASVVVKILSPNLTHKSDIGGIRLDLTSSEEVEKATRRMLSEIKAAHPDALIEGVTVQPMIHRKDAYELILGISIDPTFGPVILFGAGGTGVEAIGDSAMSLTPLDLKLATELIKSTRIYKLLKGFRNQPPVDLNGLALCLVRLSSLAVQHRAIRELDINPLLVDDKGMIALDARIKVEDSGPSSTRSIRYQAVSNPVGENLTGSQTEARYSSVPFGPKTSGSTRSSCRGWPRRTFVCACSCPFGEFSHEFLARMTQIDYAREMAFVALRPDGKGEQEMLGGARFFADPDYEKGEYAILIRSDLKGHGLGWILMRHLIIYAKSEGLKTLYGSVLCENTGMLQMCRELGFRTERDPDDGAVLSGHPGPEVSGRPKVDPVALAGCPKRRKFRLHPSTGSG